jgi:hypothetical protein
LLEHAAWSTTVDSDSKGVDVEVFKRWVLEDGLKDAIEEVKRTRNSGKDKAEMDANIAFGGTNAVARDAKL